MIKNLRLIKYYIRMSMRVKIRIFEPLHESLVVGQELKVLFE